MQTSVCKINLTFSDPIHFHLHLAIVKKAESENLRESINVSLPILTSTMKSIRVDITHDQHNIKERHAGRDQFSILFIKIENKTYDIVSKVS